MSIHSRLDRGRRDAGDVTVVILTALDLEYRAVRRMLTGLREERHPAGTLFEVGRLPGHPGRLAVAATGTGTASAAGITERAIGTYRPRAVLFVGVAGALDDNLRIGDVVVASKVYAYHGGKHDDHGAHSRPAAWLAPHDVEQLARRVARDGTWSALLPPDTGVPRIHFKPIAAGEVVLDSRSTPLARDLHHHFNDAVAIDMESAGAAQAGHLNPSSPVLTIRGISDHADGRKAAADRAGSQDAAAANAAALAVAVAAEIVDGRLDQASRRQRLRRVGIAVMSAAAIAVSSVLIYTLAVDRPADSPWCQEKDAGLSLPEPAADKVSFNIQVLPGRPPLLKIEGYRWGTGRRVDFFLDGRMDKVFACDLSEGVDGKVDLRIPLDDVQPGRHEITARPYNGTTTLHRSFLMPAEGSGPPGTP